MLMGGAAHQKINSASVVGFRSVLMRVNSIKSGLEGIGHLRLRTSAPQAAGCHSLPEQSVTRVTDVFVSRSSRGRAAAARKLQSTGCGRTGIRAEEAYGRQLTRLLRARRERPRSHRTGERVMNLRRLIGSLGPSSTGRYAPSMLGAPLGKGQYRIKGSTPGKTSILISSPLECGQTGNGLPNEEPPLASRAEQRLLSSGAS
jgi:hypothetical protein